MPFGVKSHRDGLRIVRYTSAKGTSPMPFGVKSHRDLASFHGFPARVIVTNAFRREVPSGRATHENELPAGTKQSPMPFGVKSHRDPIPPEATPTAWESPMPFGVKSHRDKVVHGLSSESQMASPMPFGVKSHRDVSQAQWIVLRDWSHQCLSA